MTTPLKTALSIWIRPLLGTAIAVLGLLNTTPPVRAADIVCRGTLFGDTDFAAYYGEIGFGRMELKFPRGRIVEVPLLYEGRNPRGENLFRGNNPDQPSDRVEVIAPRTVLPGTRIRVRYNGNVFPGDCFSTRASRPPSNSTPIEGSFLGRGRTNGSVFGSGRPTEATLNFNRGNFSLGLAVPPGTGAQVNYSGTINRLRSTNPDNINSFILEGRVKRFASSVNNLRVFDTVGICRIEVFDARVISTDCNADIRGSITQFTGMKQF